MVIDSLYRISLKCLIKNEHGEVLVTKEKGRTSWDLPGGGIEHGETFKTAIARELNEEVGFQDDFAYRIIEIEEPAKLLTRDIWQIRLIFLVEAPRAAFLAGPEADDVTFIRPEILKNSDSEVERLVYRYAALVR